MKQSKMLKRCCALYLLCLAINMVPQAAVPVLAATQEQTVQPMTDQTVWRFKKVNGKRYKRLYNITTQKWIGDWIPA